MDPDVLRQAVEQAGFAAVGLAFLAGIVLTINPVALAAIPVSLAYVTRARAKDQAILFAGMFILGLVLTHAVLGFIAGLGGAWVSSIIGRQWGLVLGPLLIVLGLLWPGWVRLPLPALGFRAHRPVGAWDAFLLAVPFSIAVCPGCSPALVVLLGVTAGLASPWLGFFLLLAFGIGRAIPIAVGAVGLSWLENLRSLDTYRHTIEAIGGLVLIASGLYMLNTYFFWIPELAIF